MLFGIKKLDHFILKLKSVSIKSSPKVPVFVTVVPSFEYSNWYWLLLMILKSKSFVFLNPLLQERQHNALASLRRCYFYSTKIGVSAQLFVYSLILCLFVVFNCYKHSSLLFTRLKCLSLRYRNISFKNVSQHHPSHLVILQFPVNLLAHLSHWSIIVDV